MKTRRLTLAQALVRYMAALRIENDGRLEPYLAGVWAIFGHGNVAGLGEALHAERATLPTWRAHNEQGMALAAIAYSKARFRQRAMAVTTSIGPGATNLVTAAALAHVNRLPVLLLPGDVFASRSPDPVLQQLEDFGAGDVSVNEALRPVTRYFDRLMRPEQVLQSLPRAIQVMTDPAQCGPVCLALPQDVQAQSFDCPEEFLHPEPLRVRRPNADSAELLRAADLLRQSQRPLIVAGGGVLYSLAAPALREFVEAHGIPVAETQAGKSSLPWDHVLNVGAIGVTGSPAANALAREADLILAIGTRLQDFTTGSHALFPKAQVLALNVQPLDAAKWHAMALVADARAALSQLRPMLSGWLAAMGWTARAHVLADDWRGQVDRITVARSQREQLPYEAEVIGAVRDSAADSAGGDIVVCAAGGLPAELHKLWRTSEPGGYHLEYGYSCMGYEIAGGLGVKMARPDKEVIVMVGDGSYLMMNSELATAAMLRWKLIVVLLDNRGYGCIHRLQRATGNARFNNLLDSCGPDGTPAPHVDFCAHARSMGVDAYHAKDVADLKFALGRARAADGSQLIVIDTTPECTTSAGGSWWEVAIPDVSDRPEVREAHAASRAEKQSQRP